MRGTRNRSGSEGLEKGAPLGEIIGTGACAKVDDRPQGWQSQPRSWLDNNATHIMEPTERLPGVRGRLGSFSYLQSVHIGSLLPHLRITYSQIISGV